MYTGTDDIKNIGVIGNWNYEKQTHYFESHCGLTNGSAGELFPPKATKTKISLFSSDICRSIDLVYKEETEVDGIRTYRFWGDENMFANYTKIPDNWYAGTITIVAQQKSGAGCYDYTVIFAQVLVSVRNLSSTWRC